MRASAYLFSHAYEDFQVLTMTSYFLFDLHKRDEKHLFHDQSGTKYHHDQYRQEMVYYYVCHHSNSDLEYRISIGFI